MDDQGERTAWNVGLVALAISSIATIFCLYTVGRSFEGGASSSGDAQTAAQYLRLVDAVTDAATLVFALGAILVGRRIRGWQGKLLIASAMALLALEIVMMVLDSGLGDGEPSSLFFKLQHVISYVTSALWLAIGVALGSACLRHQASRVAALALVIVTIVAKPCPVVVQAMQRWLNISMFEHVSSYSIASRIAICVVHAALLWWVARHAIGASARTSHAWQLTANSVARVEKILVARVVATLLLLLVVMAPKAVDATPWIASLSHWVTPISLLLATWMLIEMSLTVSFDSQGAPRLRIVLAVFAMAMWVSLHIGQWFIARHPTGWSNPRSIIDVVPMLDAIIVGIAMTSWASAMSAIVATIETAESSGTFPNGHQRDVRVTLVVVGSIAGVATMLVSPLIAGAISTATMIVTALLCSTAAGAMKHHAQATLPAAIAVVRLRDGNA